MSWYKHTAVAVIWALSVVVVGVLVHAQVAPAQTAPAPQATLPAIISGDDLGFRVERLKGETPVGRLMVRINGQWVDAEFSVGARRLTVR